ncbi:MAG: putative hydroxymethylpyrimidine transporter CytX [Clostridiaceae bacterium]|nr:putative hydroxymethylpyrimidine transporter CytX [Bacillota bacterium]NLN51408.1 putative hydroxymethylpyrimidine transporter CytX [Clostridiaceae bacterium]
MNKVKKTSTVQNGLIWFGAGVSIAEIVTGTYYAPLGFSKGLLAILLGHLIGCFLFFLAGLMGGKTGLSGMGNVQLSFGKIGMLFFAVINIFQLVGWTAIMIFQGAEATNQVFSVNPWVWSIVIGILILIWIIIGLKNLGWLNHVVMIALFALTVVLFVLIMKNKSSGAVSGEMMSFGAAVELSVAMPLSWLPLVSDYTREAEKPLQATLVSTITYGLTSIWMYVIGMGAAILTGEGNVSLIMVRAGLGIGALIILILSTVTTTFLDVYSAGVSAETLSEKINGKTIAIITTIIGTVLAITIPLGNIEPFLYLIGSFFAPMIAILIADFYILKRNSKDIHLDYTSAILWIIGFVIYRIFMKIDLPLGSTLAAILIILVITLIVRKIEAYFVKVK